MTGTRLIIRHSPTFVEWARMHGYTPPSEFLAADVLGAAVFPTPHRTRAQASKERLRARRYAEQQTLYQEWRHRYDVAIDRGEVAALVEEVSLDPENAADQAYARVLQKRAARKEHQTP